MQILTTGRNHGYQRGEIITLGKIKPKPKRWQLWRWCKYWVDPHIYHRVISTTRTTITVEEIK